MKFRVTKIAAAVATGLGMSVVGINAQADEIMFPYIINSPTVTTVLSVINDDERAAPRNVHYRYYYKTTDAGTCLEVDYRQPTSPNDIVTFDTGGSLTGADANGVVFEPAADQVRARYTRPFAVFRNIKPSVAFGVVDNNDQFGPGYGLSGEAIIVDLGTGSAWGYKAYNHATYWQLAGTTLTLLNPYDFSDRAETNGEVLVAIPAGADRDHYRVPVAVMPWQGDSPVTTRFMVTPIGVATNQLFGNLTATVQLEVNDPSNVGSFDVMYDRDENPVSGRVPVVATCVQRVDVQNLISGAAQQFLPNGGWSNVAVATGQATVFKLEYNASVQWQGSTGTFNNAFWLRKGIREGSARVALAAAGGQPALPVYSIGTIGAATATPVYIGEYNSPFPVLSPAGTAAIPAQLGQLMGKTVTGEPIYSTPALVSTGTTALYDPTKPNIVTATALSTTEVKNVSQRQ